MTITKEAFVSLFPNNKTSDVWVEALNEILPKYEINTVNRVAGFLAQCGHESGGFTILKENLNYLAKGLVSVFPKYFNTTSALSYERKPEKIANKVYANRMGNKSEASGDGWKYKGAGVIQCTGKDNYIAFSKSVNLTLEEVLVYINTTKGALTSGCWYWKSRNLNSVCDADDIVSMTKKINGGVIGLDERTKLYNKAKTLLKPIPH